MQSFILPANGAMSPEDVTRKRRLAELMMQSAGDTSPVGHWSQGATRMVNALMGGLIANKASQGEREGRKGANDALARALTGDIGAGPIQQDSAGAFAEAMNNPYMSDGGNWMLRDAWQRANPPPVDPMEAQQKQLQIELLKAKIAEANNPQANNEYGLNPQFGVDANGNPVMLQTSKSGVATQTQMPEGVTLSKEPLKFDAGTHWVLLDPITRQPIGQIPKELAEAEKQKVIGESQGKAAASAGSDIAAGEMALDILTQIENNPGIDWGTGMSSMFNFIPGTPGRDFQTLVDQSTSGAFLTAIQQMRGLGALSNIEGQTATRAVTRMSTATSKEAFLEAVKDYRAVIEKGIATARSRTGGAAPAPQGGNTRLKFNPATGELE